MKSFMAKKDQVEQKWLLVDAEGAILGRMAAKIAPILMGKTKPTYTPHVDTGDFVIVVNAEKIRVTGVVIVGDDGADAVAGISDASLVGDV